MGYDLRITRKEHSWEEDGPEISFVEWVAYALGDPDLQPDLGNPDPKNWLIVSGAQPWPLWWSRRTGEVTTKNPGPEAVVKMIAIAQALQARVIGDDDEIYDLDPSGAVIVDRR